MKFSFAKLIDVSILPAVLTVVSKILGLAFAVRLLNLRFITQTQGFFPSFLVEYNSKESELISGSISQLFTGLVLGLGCGLLLLQAYHLHETHIPPTRAARIARSGLSKFVANSFDLFHRIFIWLSLLWLITFLSFYETYLGNVSIWVSLILLLISWSYTHFLTVDVAKERVVTD